MEDFPFINTSAENSEDTLGPMAQFARDCHLAFLSKGFTDEQAYQLTVIVFNRALIQ